MGHAITFEPMDQSTPNLDKVIALDEKNVLGTYNFFEIEGQYMWPWKSIYVTLKVNSINYAKFHHIYCMVPILYLKFPCKYIMGHAITFEPMDQSTPNLDKVIALDEKNVLGT